ncbi:probable L-type lectin-domain containing receptor kinase I.6 [Punica granatum]|uniref:Probable L-type lectin-domain containing receptor kinase I.6 n=1 Tax=Punica granatum TaxID=22663 RepID=A0A6P8D6U9_PUNGR|nr:probable L-type lectin-domain containing receptor kinase I.6 [Punica granatum]
MDSALMKYCYEELVQSTDQFNKDGFIGKTQFGKVYRGKLESRNSRTTSSRKDEVTIKFWRWPQFFAEFCHWGEYESDWLMIKNERLVHEEIRSHPSVAKLIGYCDEEGRDVLIYDLRPLDSVHNLITKDNFGWLHRVKVIIHMALFIEYLHAHNPQYLIRNIDARHLMLDEGYNLKVLDFSMFLGGTFQDLVKTPFHRFAFVGSFGYKDFPTLCE